jgi:hypothetical protein
MNTPRLGPEQRACLVAARLSGAGRRQLRWLYRGLETIAGPQASAALRGAYATLAVQPVASVSVDGLVGALGELCARDDLAAVDLVLVVHGTPTELVFGPGDRVSAAALGSRLAALPGASKLRLAYSLACYGSAHADALRAAGFDAVVGARRQNTSGATEYSTLLRAWAAGATVSDAVRRADRTVPRVFWDMTARVVGRMRDVSSTKRVMGAGALTIDQLPAA